jgi:para-aminobenzoate synthetase/4-amino-4-deoxychorismate lyase
MARVGGVGVGALVEIGLIETIRARNGRVPWLARHLGRLYSTIAALGLSDPVDDVGDLVRVAVGPGDRVVRLELRGGHAEITTREVSKERAPAVIVSDVRHEPYPHKTTRREQFGRALAGARRRRADDALLITAEGYVAEGTAWSLFWWDGTRLCTPARALGILPGLGRRRVMELTDVVEEQVPVSALAGKSLFLVNAVRGIVEIGSLQGAPVPGDLRTAELSSSFWPD